VGVLGADVSRRRRGRVGAGLAECPQLGESGTSVYGANCVYTGAIVKGFRSQPLPSQSQLSVATLLTGVVTSLNGLASLITGYNVFGGSAAGSQVSVVAIMRSDMPPSS